jgi:hypothetical protein
MLSPASRRVHYAKHLLVLVKRPLAWFTLSRPQGDIGMETYAVLFWLVFIRNLDIPLPLKGERAG